MLVPGQKVASYQVLARLGEGGMATVFLARHVTLGSLVAIKVHTSTKPSIKARFAREGRIQARLHHANVVAVIDVIELGEHAGLVMEFVDGPSLSAFLRRYRPPVEDAVALFRGLAAGLGHAHDLGMIHRDLKPSNVLIAVDEHVTLAKLTDFGLAKSLIDIEEVRTRTGATLGTPSYMPPEQMRDASKVDHRADLYGLGCLLYTMVTGRPPHRGSDVFELLDRIEHRRYLDPLATLGVTPALADLLHRLLAPSPADRPADVREILDALGDLGRGPITAQTLTIARALQEEGRQKLAIAEADHREGDASLVVTSLPTRDQSPPPRALLVSPDSESRKRIRRALRPYHITPDQAPDAGRALPLLLEADREGQPFGVVIIDDGVRSALLEARIGRDSRLSGCKVVRADLIPGGSTELARVLGHVLQGRREVDPTDTLIRPIDPGADGPPEEPKVVLVYAGAAGQRAVAAHLVRQSGFEVVEVGHLDELGPLLTRGPSVLFLDLAEGDVEAALRSARGGGCLAPAVLLGTSEIPSVYRTLGVIAALPRPLTSQAVRASLQRMAPRRRPRAPILDPGVLTRLRADIGGDDALRSVIGVFLQDVDAEVLALRACQADPVSLERRVSRLETSARQLGAAALAEACQELAHARGDVGALVDQVVDTLQRTSQVLDGWTQRGARRAS